MPAPVVNRFNLLRGRIVEVEADVRHRMQRRIRNQFAEFGQRALRRLQAVTPIGAAEDSSVAEWRGSPGYAVPYHVQPSIRQHGVSLLDGWQQPRVLFTGSRRDLISASMVFRNTAPHARVAIFGTDATWTVTPTNVRALMWPAGDTFVFRAWWRFGPRSGNDRIQRELLVLQDLAIRDISNIPAEVLEQMSLE